VQVREKAVRYIVNQMDRYLISQRDFSSGFMARVRHFVAKMCCLVGGRDYGNYLITTGPTSPVPQLRRTSPK